MQIEMAGLSTSLVVEPDVYFKKIVTLKQGGRLLRFRVSQDLFSSFQVDVGTQFLLRTLDAAQLAQCRKALDLGCGYGPLGLTVKQAGCAGPVHMVDRDALAVEYARQNAAMNGLTDVVIYGSLGYDDLRDRDFDLILSNLPAKAGEPVIAYLLRETAYYLCPGGMVAVVVVRSLQAMVAGILAATPGLHITFHKTRPGHAVFHYRFADPFSHPHPPESAFARGIYWRGHRVGALGMARYTIQTVHGLAEFESPAYQTDLLLAGLQRLAASPLNHALIFNPGQGDVPVALWQLARPKRLVLVDRDLLSLRSAQHNLRLNGCPDERVTLSHCLGVQVAEPIQADVVAGILREDEGPEAAALTIRQATAHLAPDGTVLVAGSSTAVTRLADVVQLGSMLTIVERKRWRGHSLLVMARR